jgi:hypothetical protein
MKLIWKHRTFTLVLFQNKAQLRWNGKEKETVTLDVNKNHIWSSATLYPAAIRENVLVGSIPLWIRIMKFQSRNV